MVTVASELNADDMVLQRRERMSWVGSESERRQNSGLHRRIRRIKVRNYPSIHSSGYVKAGLGSRTFLMEDLFT